MSGFTIRFGVGITDRSNGAPFGVTRLYGDAQPEDCGHQHTSKASAEKCARRMARGKCFQVEEQGVVLHTRTDCSECGGVGQFYTEGEFFTRDIWTNTPRMLHVKTLGPCLECGVLSLGGAV